MVEWDGFQLSLGSEGLEFLWVGAGIFEVRPSHCVSASLRRPSAGRAGHEMEFRFRFPGGASGTKTAEVRVDVPPHKVEQAGHFMAVLWRDHSVPDLPEGGGADVPVASAAAPAAVAHLDAAPAPDRHPDLHPDKDPDAGPALGTASDAVELERVPDGRREWILSPAGERSEELFADVMARQASSAG
ncbi:hypothetical protein [Streptomyces sp. NPDC056480]|uniref:hypothetical protein n=1 Tax=Streptomyces sp. NPDC056480 TaxID=3345833 RepID=UPI0036C052CC